MLPDPEPPASLVEISSKFWTVSDEVGREPSHTPLTDWTASIVKLVAAMLTTLPRLWISKLLLEYLTKFPTVTIPTKVNPASAGIETKDWEPLSAATFADPKLRTLFWIVSPVMYLQILQYHE